MGVLYCCTAKIKGACEQSLCLFCWFRHVRCRVLDSSASLCEGRIHSSLHTLFGYIRAGCTAGTPIPWNFISSFFVRVLPSDVMDKALQRAIIGLSSCMVWAQSTLYFFCVSKPPSKNLTITISLKCAHTDLSVTIIFQIGTLWGTRNFICTEKNGNNSSFVNLFEWFLCTIPTCTNRIYTSQIDL